MVSGSLYASGFAETLIATLGPQGTIYPGLIPDGKWILFGYSAAVLIACLFIVIIGAKYVGKAVILFAFITFVCWLDLHASFMADHYNIESYNETVARNCTANCTYHDVKGKFFGLAYEHGEHILPLLKNNSHWSFTRDCENRQTKVSFTSVFAVLFAGVTGIMAGANVSGELKNPSKAIPTGTFAACGITFVVYLLVFFLTAMTCERPLLHHDCLYMIGFDLTNGYLILIGALLVTASACLNCLMGE